MASPQNKLFLSTLSQRQRLKKVEAGKTFSSNRKLRSPRSSILHPKIVMGLALSSAIGLLAYRRKSLSSSGVLGALVTGTTVFGSGGWTWAINMIFFFISSSLLSHWKEQEKERTAIDKFSKGSQRDLGQVTSNGGVATLLALGYGLSRNESVRKALEAGYVGASATATADTWATEIGVLSPQKPRLITTGQTTMPGTSGGITPIGAGASAAGALAQGSVFWLLKRRQREYRPFPLIALVSGLVGSLFDSLLGATVQAMYYCPKCDKETEKHVHSCGTPTKRLRGLHWINNDVVNFLATLFGSLIAIAMWIATNAQERQHKEVQ